MFGGTDINFVLAKIGDDIINGKVVLLDKVLADLEKLNENGYNMFSQYKGSSNGIVNDDTKKLAGNLQSASFASSFINNKVMQSTFLVAAVAAINGLTVVNEQIGNRPGKMLHICEEENIPVVNLHYYLGS